MSIIKHVTLQKIVAHDFRYDPRITGIDCMRVMALDAATFLPIAVAADDDDDDEDDER